ncbi:MAG: HEAT repeat domain-containing protein, partial [Caldilineaceae bacterium]|nr:HEAT repeat domain-containing protein [Caldilineaceae bacterium]
INMLAALGVLIGILRQAPAVYLPGSADAESNGEDSQAPQNVLADTYIVLLLAMYICFGLGDYFVDNIFYSRVEGQLPHPDQLASFLGIFASVVSGLSLVSHLFLSHYILKRYGVRTIILLTPLLLLASTCLFAFSGLLAAPAILLFWSAVVMNLIRQVTDAFDNTAANLLYQPLPAGLRMRTQTMVDGVIYPAAGGVAGLLLLFLTDYVHLNSLQLAYVLLPLVVIWLGATLGLGRAYPQRVQQALRRRLVTGDHTFTPDRVSLEIIEQHLYNPYPRAVLYALDLLTVHSRDALPRLLPPLLTHPAVEVRLAAIAQVEALGSTQLLDALAQHWSSEQDETVRSAALRTLATVGGQAHTEPLLE